MFTLKLYERSIRRLQRQAEALIPAAEALGLKEAHAAAIRGLVDARTAAIAKGD